MADFSKFKIGNTSYNVKDAAAGKSLSVSGSSLSLKNAAGTAISTVTLPGGGGAYIILTGAYNSTFNALVISSVVSDAGHTITKMQNLYDAVKNDGAAVYLVDETNSPTHPAEIIPLSYIYENALDPDAFDVGFIGVTKGWVSTRSPSNTLSGTPWTAYTPSGGGANTNIAFIAQTSGWPTLNTLYSLPGTYKLTNQIGIKSTGYGQYGQYETSILASALLIDDTYASVEDYFASSPAQGASLKIVAWFIANVNTIAKVTANCTYDGNGGYTISSVSATSATTVGV